MNANLFTNNTLDDTCYIYFILKLKMSNLKALSLVIIIFVIDTLLGHYLPPTSIFLTPIVVAAITMIFSKSNLSHYLIILCVIITICLNDILIKLTAGGTSDFEGAGLINLFFLISVVISTIIVFSVLIPKRRIF